MKKIMQIFLAVAGSSIPLNIAIKAKIYQHMKMAENVPFFFFLAMFSVIAFVNYYEFLKKRDVFGKTIW